LVVVDAGLLERHARNLLGCSLDSLRNQREVAVDPRVHKPRQMRHLSRLIRAALSMDTAQLRVPALARAFETAVLDLVLSGIVAPPQDLSASRRRALARRAESHLLRSLGKSVTIFDLCEALEAPQRTLHLAFREHFGTTPKAYLKTLRLNAVRHDLLESRGRTTVTAAAMRRGFEHLGWFSHDYRQRFGETPTQTLLRHKDA
jgi:AraC-like DNA-binding protein